VRVCACVSVEGTIRKTTARITHTHTHTHTHTTHTYRGDYPQDYGAENKRLVKDHIYLTSEVEPVFDAADVMRFGNLNVAH
jgi:hypothetical protein